MGQKKGFNVPVTVLSGIGGSVQTTNQGVRSQSFETSGVKRSTVAVMQRSGYHRREKTRWRTLSSGPSERLSSGRQPLSRGIHLLQAILKEQIILSHVRFVFSLIFPPTRNICIAYSSTSLTCKFRDLVRKWHHNSDDSTDIIFRLILSVLYFSLISSCVIHHLLWHLFFAAQFQGQMICFHY